MGTDLSKYILEPGVLDIGKLQADGFYPKEDRLKKGPIAVLECAQEIPCNPCETACGKNFIEIGEDIIKMPVLDELCSGCGLCLPKCPGLSIFILDGSLPDNEAAVTIPYELLPPPMENEIVDALDRRGTKVCDGTITKVKKLYKDDPSYSVTIKIPMKYIHDVRHFNHKAEK
jgi:Fe-S-cluster-containing hydrogenase component 2